jgi:hypothetical protein
MTSEDRDMSPINEEQNFSVTQRDATAGGILKQLDDIKSGIRNPPNAIAGIFSGNAREVRSALKDAEISAINVRKGMVDGLRRSVEIYVERHVAELGAAAQQELNRIFSQQQKEVMALDGQIFNAIFQRLTIQQASIESMVGLKEDQQKYALETIWKMTTNASEKLVETEAELIERLKASLKTYFDRIDKI